MMFLRGSLDVVDVFSDAVEIIRKDSKIRKMRSENRRYQELVQLKTGKKDMI